MHIYFSTYAKLTAHFLMLGAEPRSKISAALAARP
jgi:hypothetical protein